MGLPVYKTNIGQYKPPLGLYEGVLGLSLIKLTGFQLPFKIFISISEENSIKFLKQTLLSWSTWPKAGLLDGSLGVPWALARLVEMGIVERPSTLTKVAIDCLNRYAGYYYDWPFQYNPMDRIWPIGLIILQLLSKEDTIQRYSMDELAILRIRDCERILTQTVPGLHSPSELTAGVLHSMYYYLRECLRRRVFPKKCLELTELISQLDYNRDESLAADNIILDYMLGRNIEALQDSEILPDMGFFAFVYKEPGLFPAELTPTDSPKSTLRELIGLTLGAYSHEEDAFA